MATIVTQSQMPWWGTLATGVLEKLLDNMITDSRQNNQTAKQNALLTEASKINDVNAQTSGFSGNAFNSGTNNLLGDIVNANAPTLADNQAGYNFHPSGLTATSPYRGGEYAYQQAGYNNLNYGTPAVNNGLTLNKIMQALANDPTRFRSVNMADMAKLAEPYVAEAQALRDKTERENLANTIYQDGKFNPEQLAMMYLRGLIGDNAYNNINAQYTMTPQQQAELNYRNAKLAQDARQFDANLRYNYYNTDTGNAFNYARLGQDAEQFGAKLGENARQYNATHELNKQNADTNETAIIVTNDGETYRVNKRTGETTSVKDPETGKTLTQAVKTEDPKSAVEEIKTLLQARQDLREEYNRRSREMQQDGTFNTSSSQNELKQMFSAIWQYDWDINELKMTYDNNPKLKDVRHRLLQRAVDYGLKLPAGVDASLYTRAEGTAEGKPQQKQANKPNTQTVTKVDSEMNVTQQPAQSQANVASDDVKPGNVLGNLERKMGNNPVDILDWAAKRRAEAMINNNNSNNPVGYHFNMSYNVAGEPVSGDVSKPINSTNGRPTAGTDVTGGNPNGTTSSVNGINIPRGSVLSLAEAQAIYNGFVNGEYGLNHGIRNVNDVINLLRTLGVYVDVNK